MILQEGYELCSLTLKYNKRELNLNFKGNSIYAIYTYNGKEIGDVKNITIQKWFKFQDKYRGKKERGYNRPAMCFREFDTKVNYYEQKSIKRVNNEQYRG